MRYRFSCVLVLAVVLTICTALPTMAKPHERQVPLSTGVNLRVVVDGPQDGTPIIFLHGYTDSSHSWSSTTPWLADTYRTYVPDQRGHGDSDRPGHGYTVAQYAEDVIAMMDQLQIQQAVIVGHSMGSIIAHQVASAYPDRVSQLVLVASVATGVGHEVMVFMWDEIVGLPEFQDPIDPDFIRDWQTGPNPVDPEFFEKVLEETGKVPARVWKAALRGMLTDDHRAFFEDVTAPTMIIWGTQDAFFSQADQDTLLLSFSDAVFIPYEGAGHNLQWEQPQRVADDIRAFIE